MRNLKKIVAVIMAVAMIASMMVPALAASVANEEQAKALKSIGLFKGVSDTDLGLAGALPRIQAMTLIIRAKGQDAAALALTQAEIDEQLAKLADASKIDTWAKPYAAYALKTGITTGVGRNGKIYFDATAATPGTSYVTLVLRAMGYADVDYTNPWDTAVAAKISTAVALGLKTSLIRDEAVGVLYAAVKTGVCKDGKTLIETLIAGNAVTQDAAATAGFVAPKPTVLKVVSATATNLKEIVVTFDSKVNKDQAETAANYTVENKTISKVKLNSDGKSVTIILSAAMSNQSDFKVTVKSAVKSDAGVAMTDDTTVSGSIFDVTIPVALSATQAGPDSFKVTFSEPISALSTSNFKVDGGLYFVQSATAGDDGYSATVKLYATIPTGEHKVEVSGVKDYAGYSVVTTNLAFVATKDEAAPTIASIKSATPEKVVIVFNEDIVAVTSLADIASKIYHTNSANVAASASIDGKELTLNFTNKLPNGTAYLTIAKEIIKDAWGNKNAEVKDLSVAVTVDSTKPEIKKIEAKTDMQIIITFTEDMQAGNGKYKLLDASGKDVTGDYTITPTRAAATLTLDFNKAIPGGTYQVSLEGLKDLAGNEMLKASPSVTVTDTTAPVVSTAGILYTSKKIVKIQSNEVMNSNDLLNLANYQIGTKYLSDTKATASLADGGKAVLIDLSKTENISIASGMTITVGKIRDAAGNYTANFVTTVVCNDMDSVGIAISKVEATGKKTVVVTLNDALSNFEADDFIVNNATVAGVSFANNSDGKGVITFTLTEDLTTTGRAVAGLVSVSTSSTAINSANSFGVKVAANQTSGTAADKIAPEIASATFNTTGDTITINFSEAVKGDTLSRFTFTVSGNTVTSVTTSADAIVLTLKDKVATVGTKVTVTQVSDIEDAAGNVVKGMTKEVEKK